MYKASVIIAFYNKIDYLRLVFAGLERQVEKGFEVIIADDGSSTDVVKKLKGLISQANFDVQHIWHEDQGWRKNIILNKSIVVSKSDQLIFMDADCIPHKRFVEEHIKNKKSKTILTGRRANLSEEVSKNLTYEKVKNGSLERLWFRIFMDSIVGKVRHAEKAIYVKNTFLRKRIQKKEAAILGCNFSMNKSDLLCLNGFDERYLEPAVGEDTDIELRARQGGLKLLSINYMAIQFHLFHKTLQRGTVNSKILEENRKNQIIFTPHGIKKKPSSME